MAVFYQYILFLQNKIIIYSLPGSTLVFLFLANRKADYNKPITASDVKEVVVHVSGAFVLCYTVVYGNIK